LIPNKQYNLLNTSQRQIAFMPGY